MYIYCIVHKLFNPTVLLCFLFVLFWGGISHIVCKPIGSSDRTIVLEPSATEEEEGSCNRSRNVGGEMVRSESHLEEIGRVLDFLCSSVS